MPWEFVNGLGEFLSFGKDPPFIISTVENLNAIKLSYGQIKTIGQDGVIIQNESVQPLNLVVRGLINVDIDEEHKLNEYINQITSIFNPKKGKGLLRYIDDNNTTYEIECVISSFEISNRPIDKTYTSRKFKVELLCPNPYWKATTTLVQMGYGLGGFSFPLQLPTKFAEILTKVVITNYGDAPVPLLIKFYGPATTPELRNNTTGEVIRVNRVLTSDEVLIINTDDNNLDVQVQNLTTGTTEDAWNYIDITACDFFKLQIGDNEIEFSTGDATEDARVEIYYRKRCLVV